jgi:hypothetical protein
MHVTLSRSSVVTQHTRPHSYVPGGSALTGTSIDELIRPGLRHAFPLPPKEDPVEATFRRLLDALALRRSGSQSQSA